MADSQHTSLQATDRKPVKIADALGPALSIIGGDTCREFLGMERGYCEKPAHAGLCPEHYELRRIQLGIGE